jgi:hypothetical protein
VRRHNWLSSVGQQHNRYGTLLRRFGSGQESDTEAVYYKGLLVEARYCGRAKWSMGVVHKENLDGTFDVEYTDGELNRVEKVCQSRVLF